MTKRLSLLVVLFFSLSLVLAVGPGVSFAAQEKGNPAASKASAKGSSEKPSELTPCNLNTATVQELQKLPGIGPKTAEEIVKYREANGPYKSADDLVKVKGIGPAKTQKIKNMVTVE